MDFCVYIFYKKIDWNLNVSPILMEKYVITKILRMMKIFGNRISFAYRSWIFRKEQLIKCGWTLKEVKVYDLIDKLIMEEIRFVVKGSNVVIYKL